MCRTGAKISSLFEHETLKKKKKEEKWQGTNNSDVRLLNRATHSRRAFTRSRRNPRPCKCLSGNRGTSSRQTFPSEARSVLRPCPKNMHVPNDARVVPFHHPRLLPSIRANRRASGRSPKRRDLPGTFLPVTQPLLVLSPSSRSHRHFHLVSSSSSPSVSLSISPRKDGPSPLRSPRYAPPFLSFQFLPRRRLPVAVVSFFPPLEISFVLKYLKEGWYRGGG